MTLQIHNTRTKTLDSFTSLNDKTVSIYTCGPTVYDYPHVGNWTGYIYWDTLIRLLLADGYDVNRVMNITDVGHLVSDEDHGEDKLEKGARREGKTAWEVAEFYSEDFVSGMDKLGLILPQHLIKATDFIPQQLDLVRVLKNKGFTYQINDGIYFDTSKFPAYANFAGLDLAAQKAGARVTFNPEKRNHSDFALWKFTPKGEKRDMEWETPSDLLEDNKSSLPSANLSELERQQITHEAEETAANMVMGFPGWHLECSAIAMNILGPRLDIHAGGIDHIPVHHTNEIAQAEAASGKQFANIWIHNNHLKVNGTKISKSLENGYTLQDLDKKGFTPMDFRMFVLQSQYNNEGNFTFENLEAAKNRLSKWRTYAALRHQIHDTLENDKERTVSLVAGIGAIKEALNNNLNTPEALRIVDETFSKLDSKNLDTIHQHGLEQVLETVDELLGLQLIDSTPDIDDATKKLILQRERAREEKNWQEADRIRGELAKKNLAVRDSNNGSIWEYIS